VFPEPGNEARATRGPGEVFKPGTKLINHFSVMKNPEFPKH